MACTQMTMMNRRDVVLAALAAAGENATFTPVQVQKLLFLIDREASQSVGGPHFRFVPYDYGPFDRTVYDELDMLRSIGLVNVNEQAPYRIFVLSQEGYARGQQAFLTLASEVQTFVQQAAQWVRALSFRQLVAAIYAKYPDMRANSVFR
jgi:uncharacterized protein